MISDTGDVRICSGCLDLARELIAMQQTDFVTNGPPPVLTNEQRGLVEEKKQNAMRRGAEILAARRRGDRVHDPMEWFRCGFCGGHRRERSAVVMAAENRPGICDLCANQTSGRAR